MSEPTTMLMMAGFGLVAIGMMVLAALKGWQGWLEIKRMELAGPARREGRGEAMDLIEMADLKERVRKLEAIASCVDL